jgi:hypothetical protein
MRTFHAVALADVVDLGDFGGVGVQAHTAVVLEGLVLGQRVVVPGALPELVAHVEVLLGPVVPVPVGCQAGAVEVAMGVLQRGGHHVPADPAAGDVVEGGELPREVEGVGLDDRGGQRQADPVRRRRQGGEQDERVVRGHLKPAAHMRSPSALVIPVETDDVGEERHVEPGVLQLPYQ